MFKINIYIIYIIYIYNVTFFDVFMHGFLFTTFSSGLGLHLTGAPTAGRATSQVAGWLQILDMFHFLGLRILAPPISEPVGYFFPAGWFQKPHYKPPWSINIPTYL